MSSKQFQRGCNDRNLKVSIMIAVKAKLEEACWAATLLISDEPAGENGLVVEVAVDGIVELAVEAVELETEVDWVAELAVAVVEPGIEVEGAVALIVEAAEPDIEVDWVVELAVEEVVESGVKVDWVMVLAVEAVEPGLPDDVVEGVVVSFCTIIGDTPCRMSVAHSSKPSFWRGTFCPNE